MQGIQLGQEQLEFRASATCVVRERSASRAHEWDEGESTSQTRNADASAIWAISASFYRNVTGGAGALTFTALIVLKNWPRCAGQHPTSKRLSFKYAPPHMRQRRNGSAIVQASIDALVGPPNSFPYSVAKGGRLLHR